MRTPRLRAPTPLLLALLAVGAAPSGLSAQEIPPLSIEARGGVVLPLGGFRTGPVSGGAVARASTFGVHFVYRGPSGWGPYVGFTQHRYDCTADGCPGSRYVATSWDLGMQRTLGPYGWTRAGLLFGRMEKDLGGPAGTTRVASLLGLGAEAGVGLRIPVRGRLALTPGARVGWLNNQFREGGVARQRWAAADLGVALGF